jgi:hypothetical protein
MNISIANNERFPHIYGLDKLGGEKSADGDKYFEDHEKELSKEYDEIMNVWMHRYKLGDNKKIHGIDEKEK